MRYSALQRVHLVQVSCFRVPVDGKDDAQTNRSFCGSNTDRENSKHDAGLCCGVGAIAPKGNEVQVGSVEHQFNSDKYENCIASGQRTGQSDGKEKG